MTEFNIQQCTGDLIEVHSIQPTKCKDKQRGIVMLGAGADWPFGDSGLFQMGCPVCGLVFIGKNYWETRSEHMKGKIIVLYIHFIDTNSNINIGMKVSQ